MEGGGGRGMEHVCADAHNNTISAQLTRVLHNVEGWGGQKITRGNFSKNILRRDMFCSHLERHPCLGIIFRDQEPNGLLLP